MRLILASPAAVDNATIRAAVRALMVAVACLVLARWIDRTSLWAIDHLGALARRQRLHAETLADLAEATAR